MTYANRGPQYSGQNYSHGASHDSFSGMSPAERKQAEAEAQKEREQLERQNKLEKARHEKYAVDREKGIFHPGDPQAKIVEITDPAKKGMSRAEQERRIKDGTLPPEFATLHALIELRKDPANQRPPVELRGVRGPSPQTESPQLSQAPKETRASTGHTAQTETPVQQFQHRLTDGAVKRLERNKARLTQVQGSYKDPNPARPQWETLHTLARLDVELKQRQDQTSQALMTLMAKKEFSNTPLGRLANETPLKAILGLPKSDPIQMGQLTKVLGMSPQDVDPKYRDQFETLQNRLNLLYHERLEMRAAHPALAVLDTSVVSVMLNTEFNNAAIARWIGEGFDGMRQDMTTLSQTVKEDPSKALLFDALVPQTLNTFKNPSEHQQVQKWVKQQQDKDGALKALGAAGTLGLAGVGILGGPLGWGANIIEAALAGSAILGTATAIAAFPQLQTMDLAAQASSVGGEELTNQTPEEARMNLIMGGANIILGGLDAGLQIGTIQKLSRLPGLAKVAGSLTVEQSRVLVNSLARHSGKVTDAVLDKLVVAVKTADAQTTMIIVNGDGTLTQMRPLGQAADKLEETATARASAKATRANGQKKPKDMTPVERLAYSQDKYGQVKNWDEVEPLMGQTINQQTKLPPGYVLLQKPGSKQLFILRETADDASFVPLMIEKGKIQAGKTRLSRDAMKANLKAVGINVPDGWQVNHLVPDAVAQSDPLMIEMLKRNIYDVDHAGNLLPMPGKAEMRQASPDLIGHQGSHGKYNDLVTEELKNETKDLVQEYGSLSKVPDHELRQAVERVENRMRKGITKQSPEIPTRYDPATKTRVLSEGLSDPDFVT